MRSRSRPFVLGLAALSLWSCDKFLGTKEEPPLPGKRISILVHEQTLEPDSATAGQPIVLPAPTPNPNWPQAGEILAEKDFEKMSADEIKAATDAIKRMRLPIMEVPTRRYRPNPTGARVDMRRTLRAALRSGQGYIPLMRRERRLRRPPLVIICDISGSMERYSRMMLHFMHAVTNDRDRVHTFLFGTRLTNVTRYLRYKDVDMALEKVGEEVVDWSGGTRIGACLHDFNQNWSRRVLTQGAVAIIISDGLDRDEAAGLEDEMERLHKSCRQLIWLNPLLRYEGFQPKSMGIRAMLPHVDDFRTVHSLNNLQDLTRVLSKDFVPSRPFSMASPGEAA